MRDGSAGTEAAYDGRRAALVAVVAVTLLVVLLVTVAASIGPGDVLRGGGLANFDSPSPTESSESPTATASDGNAQPDDLPVVLSILMTGLFVLFVIVVFAVAGIALREAWKELSRIRLRRRQRREHVDFEVVEAPGAEDAVAEAIAGDAAAQLASLREGTPRNGIVACWAHFERQAEQAGVHPLPWETSSEFALRILEMVRADTSAVSGLAELFREARFSEHEVTEQQRGHAVELLGQIHASLGRRTTGSRS